MKQTNDVKFPPERIAIVKGCFIERMDLLRRKRERLFVINRFDLNGCTLFYIKWLFAVSFQRELCDWIAVHLI